MMFSTKLSMVQMNQIPHPTKKKKVKNTVLEEEMWNNAMNYVTFVLFMRFCFSSILVWVLDFFECFFIKRGYVILKKYLHVYNDSVLSLTPKSLETCLLILESHID